MPAQAIPLFPDLSVFAEFHIPDLAPLDVPHLVVIHLLLLIRRQILVDDNDRLQIGSQAREAAISHEGHPSRPNGLPPAGRAERSPVGSESIACFPRTDDLYRRPGSSAFE